MEPTERTTRLAVSEFTCAEVSAASLICLSAALLGAVPVLPLEQPLIAIAIVAPAAAVAVIHRDGR